MDYIEYGENVAAIAAILHADIETYDEIYDILADDVGGFVGIWSLCAEAGKVFTEESSFYTPGEHFCWVDTIEFYTKKFQSYLQTGRKPSIDDLHLMADAAIETHLTFC